MTPHNEAPAGTIAKTVLLPGDPLRAKYIADNFLEDVRCYNNIRGMLGYTGVYKDTEVSVQGTGMGIPSISIYIEELMEVYKVKNLIRIGTCGCFQPDIDVREIILAQTSSTDSSINKNRFKGMDYAPCADFEMLLDTYIIAKERGLKVNVGGILTSDIFYADEDRANDWKKWAAYGVMAVEMETTALYTLAAKHKRKALSILTVSDHLATGKEISAEDRQNSLNEMITIGLKTAIKQ